MTSPPTRPLTEPQLFATLPLARGEHGATFTGEACALEQANLIAAGRLTIQDWAPRCPLESVPFTDDHPSISRVIRRLLIGLNDTWDDGERQRLKPYVPRILCTASTDAAEHRRAWMATDWLVRVQAPAFLRLAGLGDCAHDLESLARLTDAPVARAAQPIIQAVRMRAAAAREAARDPAREAAWDAAWAAARDPAREAAWDAAWAAARAAAGAAARDAAGAAAREAAWAAAWAAAGAAARDAARDAAREAAWAAAWAAAGAAARAAARDAARDAAREAARDAAWAAAWAAAGAAARDAAWAAAWDAAGAAAGAAARDAAWAAARAAAGDAARDAAREAAREAARAALRPAVEMLRGSVLDLLDAMIAVGQCSTAEPASA